MYLGAKLITVEELW